LCIDDEDLGLEIRKMVLEREGFTVLTARDGMSGISVFDSEQAASRPALSVSAQTAVSSLFIAMPPSCGVAGCEPYGRVATHMPPAAALTGFGTTITNACDPIGKGDSS